MPRPLRLLARVVAMLALLATVAALCALLWMRASLPQLDGHARVAGLAAEVSVERDALGSVTIDAASEFDAMRALGFVHAQERYFEMDLMRRSAAGELAQLFGPRAVVLDRRVRVHRMRARSVAALAAGDGDEGRLIQAYTDGVNAGLDALRARPWAYLLLRERPQPWRAEDTLLVGHAMAFDLHDSGNRRELALLQARRHLPDALVALLGADGSPWDAPLTGAARPALTDEDLASLAALWRGHPPSQTPHERAGTDADAGDSGAVPPTAPIEPDEVPGSNNFAVSGALTAHGGALVADDMHLGLRAPNIWFRARLRYPAQDAPDGRVDVTGVSLPGLPGIVVGSTGHVAWGFTNSYGDWHDFIRVHWVDEDRGRYRVPGGSATVERAIETIAVKGGDAVELTVEETRWGPIVHEDTDGSSLALAWTPHRPGSLDLGLLGLTRAANLDEAMDIANRSGIPPQNFVAGDRFGRIGWTLIGRIPNRVGGCDPQQPLDPVERGCDWDGWVAPDATPRLLDPADGRLWTANSRVADGDALALIGDGGYDLGARQAQIRDGLRARERFDEQAMLDIQLDDRALFLAPWWELLRAAIDARRPDDTALAALDAPTREWEGHASIDAVAYRITRGFRGELLDLFANDLLAPVREGEGDDYVAPRLSQIEALLWPVSSRQLAAWLPADHADWPALFEAAAASLVEALGGEDGLAQRSWGERNTARIGHPLAAALPRPLARALSMPTEPLPGDSNLPRAQGPAFGASQRLVVAPGREADGILHMPGGQSGHPLSPFWSAGHGDWVDGRATPLLPGPPTHRLVLGSDPEM